MIQKLNNGTKVELCDVCYDLGFDNQVTDDRGGIPCCSGCAKSWDEMENEIIENASLTAELL